MMAEPTKQQIGDGQDKFGRKRGGSRLERHNEYGKSRDKDGKSCFGNCGGYCRRRSVGRDNLCCVVYEAYFI